VKLRRLWICLLLAGCGSNKPAPAPTPAPTASAPEDLPVATKQPAAEPATAEAPPAAPKSLFERLGGTPAITAVVDEFVNRTTSDPRIKYRFFNTDPVNLKRLLTEFVSQATGGPVTYTGRDMTSSHAGMDLVDDEFTALVENLVGALDKFHVPDREKGELIGALGPLKPQIVVPAGKLKPLPEAALAKARALLPKVGAKDKDAAELLGAAIIAGERGQRSFAEQLFSRAEIIVGAPTVASASEVFRNGAPPRAHSPLLKAKDTAPQPATAVGKSDDDDTKRKREAGLLHGTLQLQGKPLGGLGLVMMWPKGGKVAKRSAKFRVIEQRNKTFAPHVMAVPVGSTVAFPNFDSIYHNVFSLSQPRFDLGMYKSGDMRQMVFDKPGIIRLGCNIHANMSAYLIVVDAPHYAVADQDGTFSFGSLKPGKYKVEAWSERSAEPLITELTIRAGDNQTTVDLKGGAAQGPSEDKFGAAR
jgi:hemoglobin